MSMNLCIFSRCCQLDHRVMRYICMKRQLINQVRELLERNLSVTEIA